jgi:hypothetical protein
MTEPDTSAPNKGERMPHHDVDSGWTTRGDLDARIEQYRRLILQTLDGLTDEQACAITVLGRPSVLGVVRHTAFVEGVWFGEAVTGRGRRTVMSLFTHVLSELAWNTGQLDILRAIHTP